MGGPLRDFPISTARNHQRRVEINLDLLPLFEPRKFWGIWSQSSLVNNQASGEPCHLKRPKGIERREKTDMPQLVHSVLYTLPRYPSSSGDPLAQDSDETICRSWEALLKSLKKSDCLIISFWRCFDRRKVTRLLCRCGKPLSWRNNGIECKKEWFSSSYDPESKLRWKMWPIN